MNPHVDGSILRAPAPMLFARARFWQELIARIAGAYASWRAARRVRDARLFAQRDDWEILRQEERYLRATDHHHLERMERDWDRRDVKGLPGWEWR